MMRGFTLLETLMYICLFALIMEGGFTGIFAISESADRNQARAYLGEEGEFIAAKISYEISQSTYISLFDSGATSTEVDFISDAGVPTSIRLLGDAFVITRGNETAVPFSSNLVQVKAASFSASSSLVSTSFTLETRSASGRRLSEDFSSVSYTRI
jgi:hypothetical protein